MCVCNRLHEIMLLERRKKLYERAETSNFIQIWESAPELVVYIRHIWEWIVPILQLAPSLVWFEMNQKI